MTVRPSALVVPLALLTAGAALLAQTGEDDRRRAVGDWLVEDAADPDGGRAIGLEREFGDYQISYKMWVRPDGSLTDMTTIVRLNCGQGGGGAMDGGDVAARTNEIRGALAAELADCEAPADEAEAALDGFGRAYALAASWVGERADQARTASADMSMDMGSDVAMDMGSDVAMDMNMDMGMGTNMTMTNSSDLDAADMNAAIDMNATEPPE